MGKVLLEGLEFYAYHGYYSEERKIGNKYSVDVEVVTEFFKTSVEDELSNTVNYETLYKIVRKEMSVPTKLLESIGRNIIGQINSQLGKEHKVKVRISKFNPPIGGICNKATIEITNQE